MQALGSEGVAPKGLLHNEAFNELDKMKDSTQATHEWFQGVGHLGESMIKDILSTCGDAHRSFEWLQNILGQDKIDVDLLLHKKGHHGLY